MVPPLVALVALVPMLAFLAFVPSPPCGVRAGPCCPVVPARLDARIARIGSEPVPYSRAMSSSASFLPHQLNVSTLAINMSSKAAYTSRRRTSSNLNALRVSANRPRILAQKRGAYGVPSTGAMDAAPTSFVEKSMVVGVGVGVVKVRLSWGQKRRWWGSCQKVRRRQPPRSHS